MEPPADLTAAAGEPASKDERDRIRCSLHVADLDPRADEAELESYFAGVPGLKAIKIPRDRHSGVSLGYAYLSFEKDEQVRVAPGQRALAFSYVSAKRRVRSALR